MKSYKSIIADVATCALLALPLAGPAGFFYYKAHESGFVRAYDAAVQRNADTDGDGHIAPTEELRFKQALIGETVAMKEKGKELVDIVAWLEKR